MESTLPVRIYEDGGSNETAYAVHKAVLSGILGGCSYSVWGFQRRRLQGLAIRSGVAGLCCGSLSYGVLLWQAQQARRHSDSLMRLRENAEAIQMVPIDNLAPRLPLLP